jgi:hypothetical protein
MYFANTIFLCSCFTVNYCYGYCWFGEKNYNLPEEEILGVVIVAELIALEVTDAVAVIVDGTAVVVAVFVENISAVVLCMLG